MQQFMKLNLLTLDTHNSKTFSFNHHPNSTDTLQYYLHCHNFIDVFEQIDRYRIELSRSSGKQQQ